ncbi:hypothetical protein ACFMBG_15645 [Leisingera sp. D0M16]|uniref:hypothetical protein n=1 Tax=Leisingera coralii TaxID=3351347 RepID=UPI003B7C8D41
MTHKKMLFYSKAREKLLRGMTALAEAVRVTLGLRSDSVLLQKNGAPLITEAGPGARHRLALHRTRQASTERLHRKLQRQTAR